LDPKNSIVGNYTSVKKQLASPFKTDDPDQTELLANLTTTAGYKFKDSERGHYRIYYQNADKAKVVASVKRRLALMEDTLDTFYYWFAMQDDSSQRGEAARTLPKHRLNAILTPTKTEYETKQIEWGFSPGMV